MMRAGLARSRGDMAGAATGFLNAYQLFLASLGADSVYPWNAAMEYCNTQRLAGNGAEAEPLLLETVANLRRIAKPDSFEIMLAAGSLGEWRARQDRHAEAAPLLLEATTVAESMYGAAHPSTVSARLAYAASLLALGDAESLSMAKTAAQRVLETDNKETPLTADARDEAQRLLALIAVETPGR